MTRRLTLIGLGTVATAAAVGFGAAHGEVLVAGQGRPLLAIPEREQPSAGRGEPTADQARGVVEIDTVLGFAGGRGAGTGMVLTADGKVLTNKHVVRGATQITVTLVATGKTYDAEVIGTAETTDVALLQLEDAAGLPTVDVDPDGVDVGEDVTAVGNAGGRGTTTADGTVTALDRSITASDSDGSKAERLTGLIETDADLQPGDSGGPLLDEDGEVVGVDVAASSQGGGYAIPIDEALDLADEIDDGVDTDRVDIGYPAMLGISTGTGGVVRSVVDGGPADDAGITPGSRITAIGGRAVQTAEQVRAAVTAHRPGDRVSVTWVDASGEQHTATVTLAEGPVS